MRLDDKSLLEMGTALWRPCYGDNKHDDMRAQSHVYRLCNERLPELAGRAGSTLVRDKRGRRPDVWTIDSIVPDTMRFAAKWVDGGCRTLTSDAKYFSAMAQTRADGARGDLHIPWSAFTVEIPPGIIVDADGIEYRKATFAQYAGVKFCPPDPYDEREESGIAPTASYYSIMSECGVSIHSYWPNLTLADQLCGPDPVPDSSAVDRNGVSDIEETGSDARIRELVKRATVGLLYTLQHTNNWRFGGRFDRAGQGVKLRSGPPPHRTIFIGRPISVDVRAAVREDAKAGSHAAPSVQTLVRGHLKRQVVGTQGSGRKVIWVEPYWRGPEDAPILARPIRVGA